MHFKTPFLRLPLSFDADALATEVSALPEAAWTAHPDGFPGNNAVRLVSPGGEASDLSIGAMGPTPWLQASPYIREIMAELDGVWGRSRLMGLAPGAEVPDHVDIHYYWQTHIRLHIPVITDPAVEFTCDGETIHMAPGECWTFDSFRRHEVQNRSKVHRVHLVLDTVGGAELGRLIEAATAGQAPRLVRPGEGATRPLRYEQVNSPDVMTPWELMAHVRTLAEHTPEQPARDRVFAALDRMMDEWKALWAEHGTATSGLPAYMDCIARTHGELEQAGSNAVMLKSRVDILYAVKRLLFENAISPAKFAEAEDRPAASPPTSAQPPMPRDHVGLIDRPIFIVSPPRSGSTMLFEALARANDLFAVHGESHGLIEGVREFQPQNRGWESNRLTAADSAADRNRMLAANFYHALRDGEGRPAAGPARMLEKTPKNALRVPLFDAIWPDSHFVYLYRDPRQTIASMIEAWTSGRFRTYPQLPDWPGPPWSMLLVPGWRELAGLPLEQVAAHQWAITTHILLDDLERLAPGRVHKADYDRLTETPADVIADLARALDLTLDQDMSGGLPLSWSTVSVPKRDKWRRIEPQINAVRPIFAEADRRARAFAGLLEPID